MKIAGTYLNHLQKVNETRMNKKMKLFFWFCFVLLFYYSEEKTVPNHCPNYCVCDIYINLKRATCTNNKIVSIETSVSNKVQYLDLSYNYITQIDDGVFQVRKN